VALQLRTLWQNIRCRRRACSSGSSYLAHLKLFADYVMTGAAHQVRRPVVCRRAGLRHAAPQEDPARMANIVALQTAVSNMYAAGCALRPAPMRVQSADVSAWRDTSHTAQHL
jgi:hypothetical protein